MQANLVGFFSSADQPIDAPTYDPPHDAPCPLCGRSLTPDDVRTHSIMYAGGAARSYFYRTHRTCYEAATDAAFEAVEAMPPAVPA